ncbi:MAG: 4a-hydroxytetrahydrobiopterin dehydratase [Leptolyngbyaceae cyanobacterium SL_7_1]|nr:4a-hydroxytetrahydrobiopterin dehydratase [Leptolyngbyaceae cyanobacterium SL_7_1]
MAIALPLGLLLSTPPIQAAVPTRLSPDQVSTALDRVPSWTTDGQTLSCTYRFDNFVESVAFVNRLVEPAEQLAHHPDLTIVYNKVHISLTTHDAGGLTELDFALAEAIAAASGEPGEAGRSCEG